MDLQKIDGVFELKWAQSYFIEVLLTSFRINRTDSSCHIIIQFNENSKTVTRRIAVEKIRDVIPDFSTKAKKYQETFDNIFFNRAIGCINYDDLDFPFRYASGGTLPILQLNGKEYYCLFYRDVFPEGWNIANGGCDSLSELLVPSITITRELAEELIILSPHEKYEYIYEDHHGKVMSRPEFEIARNQWKEYFPSLDLGSFIENKVKIQWINGPDKITSILTSNEGDELSQYLLSGFFLNITPNDFSIEIDKVAKIAIDNDDLLLDGEISDNHIRCRPIGLFEVEKTNNKIMNDEKCFFPDILYYLGTPITGTNERLAQKIIDANIRRLIGKRLRSAQHLNKIINLPYPYNLCPITSAMIKRYVLFNEDNIRTNHCMNRIFLSHSTKDIEFINRLYDSLIKSNINCFKAPEGLRCGGNLLDELFKEIGNTNKLLIVISENSLQSGWVKDEVNEAIRIENSNARGIIIPIRIDNAIFNSDKAWAKRLLSSHISDFTNWKNITKYENSVKDLIKVLEE